MIEIKTRLDDIGALERQIAWYERSAQQAAHRSGWRPRRIVSWVLVLASAEVEVVLRANREVLKGAFPIRARAMSDLLDRPERTGETRGVALIDPASRRRTWLIAGRIDGRRSPVPYRDYADAARRFSGLA